jgi:transposase
MSNSQKKYDEGFKERAVRMSYSSERSVAAVAASLGVTSNMLYRWRKKYTPDGDKTQLAELSELRKRVAELKEENYILKKRRKLQVQVGHPGKMVAGVQAA